MSHWFLPYSSVNQPCVYICPLLEPPSPSIPSHPSKSSQSPRLSSLCYTATYPLFTGLLLTREDAHTLSLWVCISSLLPSQLNGSCVLSYFLLCFVSNNKPCTCIYSFCFHDKCIFHWGQRSREKELLAPNPCWSGGLGFLVFIQAT